MTTFLGCRLLTDWKPLEDLLQAIEEDMEIQSQFEERFPGMLAAVFRGICQLKERRVNPDLVMYRNFRVQVWPAEGFDADPSIPIRILPTEAASDTLRT